MPTTERTYTVKSKGVGLPDYAARAPLGQVRTGAISTLTDLAELAARLGSVVTFDRRGYVVLLDDFEDGIESWESSIAGSGSLYWTAGRAERGGFSMASQYSNGVREITRNLPVVPLGKNGLEVAFAWGVDTDTTMSFLLSYYAGATLLRGGARYSEADHALYILDSTGAWVLVASDVRAGIPYIFNNIKFVTDFNTKKYERLLFNGAEYDLSDHNLNEAVDASAPHMLISLMPITTDLVSWTAWFDTVIVTQNEPANT